VVCVAAGWKSELAALWVLSGTATPCHHTLYHHGTSRGYAPAAHAPHAMSQSMQRAARQLLLASTSAPRPSAPAIGAVLVGSQLSGVVSASSQSHVSVSYAHASAGSGWWAPLLLVPLGGVVSAQASLAETPSEVGASGTGGQEEAGLEEVKKPARSWSHLLSLSTRQRVFFNYEKRIRWVARRWRRARGNTPRKHTWDAIRRGGGPLPRSSTARGGRQRLGAVGTPPSLESSRGSAGGTRLLLGFNKACLCPDTQGRKGVL
jgi:hypothetical protein